MLAPQRLLAATRPSASTGLRALRIPPTTFIARSPYSTATSSAPSSAAPSASPELEFEDFPEPAGPIDKQWYHVGRSENGELPVYSKMRNGTQVLTIVRKVEGNVGAFQRQLNDWFERSHLDPFSAPPRATIRPSNSHVQIKGHWVADVKAWLEERGF
ncbi:hypothetical protein IAT38_007646 [Cryptococcus sp. DSM 104549]